MAAADYDVTVGGATAVPSHLSQGKVTVMQVEIDCSEDNLADDKVTALFNVPKGCFIVAVCLDVVTAEGGTLTVDVGWATGTPASYTAVQKDGFLDGVNANSATSYSSAQYTLGEGTPNTLVPIYAFGYLTLADGIIYMTNNDAADAAKLRITAVIVDAQAVA